MGWKWQQKKYWFQPRRVNGEIYIDYKKKINLSISLRMWLCLYQMQSWKTNLSQIDLGYFDFFFFLVYLLDPIRLFHLSFVWLFCGKLKAKTKKSGMSHLIFHIRQRWHSPLLNCDAYEKLSLFSFILLLVLYKALNLDYMFIASFIKI